MRILLVLSLLTLCALGEIPEYHHFPVFKIDLDLPPEERFVEMATALKPQIQLMFNDYLHLAPRFIRNFFRDNEEVIGMGHKETYEEMVAIADIVEVEHALVLLLNYAFELDQALCTSVVARMPDGNVIHGRNMDFAFADAVRNASYVGQFYQNGEFVFEAVMFGGYQGVHTAFRPSAFSMTLNSRGGGEGSQIEKYFRIMGQIYLGYPAIGVAARESILTCDNFDCMIDQFSSVETMVPVYAIMAGMKENEGVVISKAADGIDNIRRLDDEHWFLLQTNDDTFAGECLQRCQDGHEHITAIGEENINIDNLLEDVLLLAHTLNKFTILTITSNPTEGVFNAFGFDSDIPYVAQAPNEELWN